MFLAIAVTTKVVDLLGSRFQHGSILLIFCFTHGEPNKRKGDRNRECGNSRPLFLPQLSQVGAGRVNRFASRGLSQYADDIQQFSFFFAITQPDRYTPLRLISCPALQPIRGVRARCARHRTGWGWEGPAR